MLIGKFIDRNAYIVERVRARSPGRRVPRLRITEFRPY